MATTPTPSTPEEWKSELYRLGEKVVLAQMTGEDTQAARAEYTALEQRLPAEVREALEGKVKSSDFVELAKTGWSFVKKLLELKAKF